MMAEDSATFEDDEDDDQVFTCCYCNGTGLTIEGWNCEECDGTGELEI